MIVSPAVSRGSTGTSPVAAIGMYAAVYWPSVIDPPGQARWSRYPKSASPVESLPQIAHTDLMVRHDDDLAVAIKIVMARQQAVRAAQLSFQCLPFDRGQKEIGLQGHA